MSTSEILIYQNKDGHIKIDVRLEDETVWFTQAQIATLPPSLEFFSKESFL